MNICDCKLCEEYKNKKNILFESGNFYVVPAIGQIVEGYLLICSKKHFIGISSFPERYFNEFEQVKMRVTQVLAENYTNPLFFEHGPVSVNKKGGCCIEHAHLHAVPVDMDILDDIKSNFSVRKLENIRLLNRQSKKDIPYFYYENQKGKKYLIELFKPVPSQYLRQLIAVKIGAPDKWNWKWHPGIDEFNFTLRKLKRKF